MRYSRKVVVLWAVVALLVLGLAAWAGGPKVVEAARAVMERVREAGPFVFFGAMVVLPLFGFPLAPFVLGAGTVFSSSMGAGWVIACAVGSVAVNLSISYWIAARWLRPFIGAVLRRLGKKLPEEPVKSGLELILLLRVIPGTPFFVQNYLLGLARVPFGLYLALSIAISAGYISAAVLLGDAAKKGDHARLAIAGVVFGVVCLVLHYLRKWFTARLRARKAAAGGAPSTEPGGTARD